MVALTRILTRGIRIGASHAESGGVWGRGATKAASIVLVRPEGVLHPGLAYLLKAIIVVRSATHAIEILRKDRMVFVRQLKEMQFLVSVVAAGRSDCQADLGPATSKLF